MAGATELTNFTIAECPARGTGVPLTLMMKPCIGAALLFAVLALSCAEPTKESAELARNSRHDDGAAEDDGRVDAPIRTDRERYVMTSGPSGPELTIRSRFTAPQDRPVYIVNCNGALITGLQRLVGGRWVDAFVAATNSCLSPPIVVPAGEEHTAEVYVHSRAGAILYPEDAGERMEPGTYRVVWFHVLTSFDRDARPFGPELPLEQRVSAPIVIAGPPWSQ